MNFRKATLNDIQKIVEFSFNLAKETENKELNKEILTKGTENLIKDSSKGIFYVVENNNEIIAQIMTTYEWSDWRNGDFIWIQSVYVKSEYRKQGIFKKMYNEIKEICESSDKYVGLRLYVETENESAKTTYESLGMKKCDYFMYEYEK
ncbi:MAG: GNAT family N-acetyltransferase [Peptostreptococcaceae bacterium]